MIPSFYLLDALPKMAFQNPLQMFARRPSPSLIVISGSLVLLFFLLFQARSSPKTGRFLGGVTASTDCLDDIFNKTLGVSSVALLPVKFLVFESLTLAFAVRKDIRYRSTIPNRPP